MKMKTITTLALIGTLTSGCAMMGGTSYKRSYVSIKDSKGETVGTLFNWEADTSAAVLLKDGQACMQTALAIKTANVEAEAKLSDAILNLSKTASKVATTPGADPATSKSLAEVTGSIKEAASSLTTTTERTAFLNMGMFYVCQISANKSLTQSQTSKIIESLVINTSKMKKL